MIQNNKSALQANGTPVSTGFCFSLLLRSFGRGWITEGFWHAASRVERGLDKVVIACDERIAAKAAGLDQRPLTRRLDLSSFRSFFFFFFSEGVIRTGDLRNSQSKGSCHFQQDAKNRQFAKSSLRIRCLHSHCTAWRSGEIVKHCEGFGIDEARGVCCSIMSISTRDPYSICPELLSADGSIRNHLPLRRCAATSRSAASPPARRPNLLDVSGKRAGAKQPREA